MKTTVRRKRRKRRKRRETARPVATRTAAKLAQGARGRLTSWPSWRPLLRISPRSMCPVAHPRHPSPP
eukprot:4580458-Pyramimonas_sp.AAC.1